MAQVAAYGPVSLESFFRGLADDAGAAHDHVLAAVRTILADGHARDAHELCRIAIERGMLPPTEKWSYVLHAIETLLSRQQQRGETPEFVQLPDGKFRINAPIDVFANIPDKLDIPAELKTFIEYLEKASARLVPGKDDDGYNIGAEFERATCDAFARLGFIAIREGGEGQPDVLAIAPLGDDTYRAVIECKTISAEKFHVNNPMAAEAARLRDKVGADYAVLIGRSFPGDKALDAELTTHNVALWNIDDLAALLRAHSAHSVLWSSLPPLFKGGRRSDDIAAFCFEHRHGAWKRARVALNYALEEGYNYQVALSAQSSDIEHVKSPLTVEVLAALVNQGLMRENALGRVGTDDIAAAMTYACAAVLPMATKTDTGFRIEVKAE
jgi:Holliday junction resolvase